MSFRLMGISEGEHNWESPVAVKRGLKANLKMNPG